MDLAAGMLLIEEADGKVTNFEGKKAGIKDKDIVASNGRIHAQILGELQ
ncbi:MAG: hypothetical protein JW772_04195 [Candidatus Diapherotrites archaeon]|nr:hypothetical protein [Candidatus Diapherotrites archaeon]